MGDAHSTRTPQSTLGTTHAWCAARETHRTDVDRPWGPIARGQPTRARGPCGQRSEPNGRMKRTDVTSGRISQERTGQRGEAWPESSHACAIFHHTYKR
eukprot:2102598-Pleurochrysis_carterae.AAC.1